MEAWPAYATCSPRNTLFLVVPQRQKSAYTAYPKAEPTPVASSAPPASSLYSSPVVSPNPNLWLCHTGLNHFPWEWAGGWVGGLSQKGWRRVTQASVKGT